MPNATDYLPLLPYGHTTPLADGSDNKFVRTVRTLVELVDRIRTQLKTVDAGIANPNAVSGPLLTWLAAAVGEPRPPWMSDADLVVLIATRVAANSWRGDFGEARRLVKSLWPASDLVDLGGMRMTLTVPNEFLPGGSSTGKSAKLYTLSRIAAAVRPAGVWLEVVAARGRVLYWGTPPNQTSYGGWSQVGGSEVYWGGNYIITGA